jgi:hypothetical protein
VLWVFGSGFCALAICLWLFAFGYLPLFICFDFAEKMLLEGCPLCSWGRVKVAFPFP